MPTFAAHWWFAAVGCNLLKPNGSIRPIVIKQSVIRLVGRCHIVQNSDEIAAIFSEQGQAGVGIKGAQEIITHGIRLLYEQAIGKVGAQWDGKNAFNDLWRTLVLEALEEDFPKTVVYFKTAYGHASEVFYNGLEEGRPDGTSPSEWLQSVLSEDGAGQGDSLGPLFYCAGHGRIIKATQRQLEAEGIKVDLVSYIDNILIPPTLPPEDCAKVFGRLVFNFASMGGIATNLSSSSAFSPDEEALARCKGLFPAGVQISPNTVILGSPLGTQDHSQQVVMDKIVKTERKLASIAFMKDLQVELLMLRFATSPAFVHLMRTLSYQLMAGMTAHLDEKCIEVLESALESPMDIRATARARLRVNDSGLGLTAPRDVTAAAFIAGLARCNQGFHLLFHQASGKNPSYVADILKGKGNGSPTMRDALQAFSYINVISGQPSNTGVDDVISFLRKAPRTIQKLLTRRMQAQRAADYTDALTHAALKARKASASDPSGNAWLFALPTCPDTTIVSWKCREAILDRLAMPSVLLGAVAGYECVCFRGPTIDPVGDHARACPCAAKYQNRLHNKGTSLLSELAKNCGYATEMEQQKMFDGDRSRPDVTIFRYHPFMS